MITNDTKTTNVVSLKELKSDIVRLIKKGRITLDGQIRDIVYLECKPESLSETLPFHYIHLLDTSGSMKKNFEKLKESVIASIEGMDDDDKVSILTFSHEKDAKFILQDVSINAANKLYIKKKISDLTAGGGTWFSTPLQKTYEFLKSHNVKEHCSACMFTDGKIEIMREYAEETNKSYQIAQQISPLVTSLNTVGYGKDYDETFLKRLAKSSQFGKYVHIDNVENYANLFNNDYKHLKETTQSGVDIKLHGMILYANEFKSLLKDDTLTLNHLNKSNNAIICILDQGENTFMINGNEIEIDTINQTMSDLETERFEYTFAKELAYNGKVNQSQEVLNKLGEVQLAAQVISQENSKQQAVYNELTQKAKKVESKEKAPLTLISVLDAIVRHNGFIDSESFKDYNKAVAVQEDTKPNFEFIETAPNHFNYKVNSNGTNINVGYTYNGLVTLDSQAADTVGLTNLLNTNVVRSTLHRAYSLVRDGKVNMPVLVVHLPKTLYKQFISQDNAKEYDFVEKIEPSTLFGYKKVTLNVAKLAIMNCDMVKQDTLYNQFISLNQLKAKAKVLKYYIGKLGSSATFGSDLTVDQKLVLKQHGLNENFEYIGFSTTRSTSKNDSVEFKIRGMATIPSVQDILSSTKKSTFYVTSMREYMEYLDGYSTLNASEQLDIYSKELKAIQRSIDELTQTLNLEKLKMYIQNVDETCITGDYGVLNISIHKAA